MCFVLWSHDETRHDPNYTCLTSTALLLPPISIPSILQIHFSVYFPSPSTRGSVVHHYSHTISLSLLPLSSTGSLSNPASLWDECFPSANELASSFMRKQQQQEETIYGSHHDASIALYTSRLPLMDESSIFPSAAFCTRLGSFWLPSRSQLLELFFLSWLILPSA